MYSHTLHCLTAFSFFKDQLNKSWISFAYKIICKIARKVHPCTLKSAVIDFSAVTIHVVNWPCWGPIWVIKRFTRKGASRPFPLILAVRSWSPKPWQLGKYYLIFSNKRVITIRKITRKNFNHNIHSVVSICWCIRSSSAFVSRLIKV